MRKYWTVFKLSWGRMLAYRFNFILGRLRNVIFLLLLFYVWRSLTIETGSFAGYTELELITYVFGVNLIRSIIFGSQSRDIAEEINSGIFSKYLTQPVNYFWFNFWREVAQRVIHLISAILEVVLFATILKVGLFIQTDWILLSLFILSIGLSVMLYFILSFLVSLIAFWSR